MGLSFAETSACAAVCVRGCVCDSSPPPSTLIKQFYSWEGTGAGGGGEHSFALTGLTTSRLETISETLNLFCQFVP